MKIFLLMLLSLSALAVTPVKVGIYHFPPFAVIEHKDRASGLILELLDLLNELNPTYRFEHVITSSNRRFLDFKDGNFDLMFFENRVWGWEKYPVNNSSVFAFGGEVYITQNREGIGQDYFNDLKDKTIVGFLGYHYGFANFNSNVTYLKQKHNATMTRSHEGNIKAVSLGRFDIGVVTKSFLHHFLQTNPEYKEKILISEKMDQKYQHKILYRIGGKLTEKEIELLLLNLKDSKKYLQIMGHYSFGDGEI